MNIPKPDFKGSFFGQTRWTLVSVKTGKVAIIETEEEKFAIPIREKREKYLWTWDGRNWLNEAQWSAMIRRMHRNKK